MRKIKPACRPKPVLAAVAQNPYGSFMRFGSIAPAMTLKLIQMASQGLSGADADMRAWRRNSRARRSDANDDFWPEVSTRYGREHSIPMKPENSAERVLFEISVVMAVVASLVLAVSLLLPGGFSQ
jgi:hypothetical protein